MKAYKKDLLAVQIHDTRAEMGAAAAKDIKACILSLLEKKETINMIFAAAPSQNEVLWGLATDREIPWNRVNAFHMDEYIGLNREAPQCFGNFLKDHIFGKLPFKTVYYIDCEATDMEAECARYSALLRQFPVDIVLLGIGENGHVAFNDPPVADFRDEKLVKVVELDSVCRQQQVNDGCFAALELVPKYALTLTVPALMAADHLVCTVPAATKAWAVERTVNGEIGEHCPATAMRRHQSAVLFCDRDSGGGLL